MSHAQLNMIRIALSCIASIWFFGIIGHTGV